MILSQMETQFICRHQSLKKAEYTRSKLKGGGNRFFGTERFTAFRICCKEERCVEAIFVETAPQ